VFIWPDYRLAQLTMKQPLIAMQLASQRHMCNRTRVALVLAQSCKVALLRETMFAALERAAYGPLRTIRKKSRGRDDFDAICKKSRLGTRKNEWQSRVFS